MTTEPSDEPPPWSQPVSDVLEQTDVSRDEGLPEDEVERRLERFGPNELREAEKRHWTEVLADQFTSFIIVLLAVAGVAAFAMGDVVKSIAIFAVFAINGAIGFVTEMRAIRSIESLQDITEIETRPLEIVLFPSSTRSDRDRCFIFIYV